jgi:hypothetical protein
VTALWLTPLLFQTGCLTIERRVGEGSFSLRSPNLEVEEALAANIAKYLTGQGDVKTITELAAKIRTALGAFDSVALGEAFSQILRWISLQEQPAVEGFRHALIFVVLKAMHLNVVYEDSDSEGSFYILLPANPGTAFIVECKCEKFTEEPSEKNEPRRRELLAKALNRAKVQIGSRRYDDRYGDEYPMVKRLAAGIVGKTDVLAEIW